MIPQVIGAFELLNYGMTVFKMLNNEGQSETVSSHEIQSLLASSTENLREVITAESDRLIEKLERDQMEVLASRLKNLEMLLRMQDKDRLFNYLLTTQESVDYARNRYLEGKQEWFTPYLIGRSVILASFSFLGNVDPTSVSALQSELKQEIHKLLNEMTTVFVEHRIEIPWDHIEATLTLQEDGLSQLLTHLQGAQIAINEQPPEPALIIEESAAQPELSADWLYKRFGGNYPNVYLHNEIPPQKLTNAVQKMRIRESVLFLYDNTVFGGARDGVCLTRDRVYWHNIGEEPESIPWSKIESLRTGSSKIYINSKTIAINVSNDTTVPLLRDIICSFVGIEEG